MLKVTATYCKMGCHWCEMVNCDPQLPRVPSIFQPRGEEMELARKDFEDAEEQRKAPKVAEGFG